MNNAERLQKLKSLQLKRRESGSFFRTADECMEWIDNVAPLLKYDEDHYNKFLSHADVARITTLSAQTMMPHLITMVGIVNQAIIELENDIPSLKETENTTLSFPEKITMKWIWEHVPARYYWYFLLILFFCIILGFTLSETSLSKSLKDFAIAIINANKTIEKMKP